MNQTNKNPQKVLVVDDNLAIRSVLKDLLELEGHHALMARNGKEALDILESEETVPKVILLDMHMPIMDGWEFRQEQKKNPKHANIPLFVFCAESKYGPRLTKMDATGILSKPIDMDDLLKSIRPFLLS